MPFALGLFVGACKKVQARCWMVHVGTTENHVSDMASRTNLRSAEEATREARWEPQWLYMTATMDGWERQLNQWAARHEMLDDVDDMDKEIEAEMREVEYIQRQF